MKNTRITTIIPKTLCGAETTQEVNSLRQMLEGGDSLEVMEDGSIMREKDAPKGDKKKVGKVPDGVLGGVKNRKEGFNMKNTRIITIIPKTLCGAEASQEVNDLRQMLEGGDPLEVMEDGSVVREKDAPKGEKKKVGKVPDGVLGVVLPVETGGSLPGSDTAEEGEADDLINEFRERNSSESDYDEQESMVPKPLKSVGKVPDGVLGGTAGTWPD